MAAILDCGTAAYHADPAPEPSLSSGIARLLLASSPMHAHAAHPRLGGAGGRAPSRAMDLGTAIHALALGDGAEMEVIEAADWRTKAAKDARDLAREAGRIPVLAHEATRVRATAAAIRAAVLHHPDARELLAPGRSEAPVVWRQGGVWNRALIDRLPDAHDAPLFDLKTTEGSAAPETWCRKLWQDGYAIQAAHYLDAAAALGRRPGAFLFVVAETEAPHGVSVVAPGPEMLAWARDALARARETWGRCLRTGEWPGYLARTHWAALPPFIAQRAEEARLAEELAA